MPRITLALVVAGLFLAGCGQAPDSPDASATDNGSSDSAAAAGDPGQSAIELADSQWRLASLAGESVEMTGGSGRAPTMHLLAGGDVSGFGGCNRYNGTYTLSDGDLSFGPIASTKMACPGVGDVERRFFAALSDTAGYRVEGGDLVLTDSQGRGLARFARSHGSEKES